MRDIHQADVAATEDESGPGRSKIERLADLIERLQTIHDDYTTGRTVPPEMEAMFDPPPGPPTEAELEHNIRAALACFGYRPRN
jgi:hypothetical protein